MRTVTGPVHARLDEGVRAVERLASPHERQALISAYHCFFGAVESAIAVWRPDAQRRAPAAPPAELVLASHDEALGAQYVLEGSSLGGRMILNALAARGADLEGLSFLDPHGPDTGRRWRAFLQELESAAPEAAERGALAAFALAEALLTARVPA